MAAVRVTIEREVWERGPRKRGAYFGPVRKWVRAWTAEVLYADRRFCVTRSVGAHQTFRGIPVGERALKRTRPATWADDGSVEADMWGHSREHPAIVRLNLGVDRWGRSRSPGRIRIAPKSVARLAEEIRRSGFYCGKKGRASGKKRA